MFAEIKRLLNHVSIYGIAVILERSLSFLLLPLYTNQFETGVYGIVSAVFAAIGFMNVIYFYGMDMAFTRFYFLREPGITRKNVFSTAYISICISSLILSIIIYFFAKPISALLLNSPEYFNLIRWVSGILFLDTLAMFGFHILRAEERSILFSTLKIIVVSVTLGLNIFFIVVLHKGIEYIFISNIIASGLKLLFVLPVILKHFTPRFSRDVYRSLLEFGLPYMIPGFAIIIMDMIDRFFILRMLDDNILGIYSAGVKLSMAMSFYVAAFRFAWHPFFLSIANRKDAKQIYSRILTYFLLVGGWIYLGISFFVNEIIRIEIFGGYLIGESYWSGAGLVPVVMPAYLLYGIYVNFVVGIYIKKLSKYLSLVTALAALLNILLLYYLIPVFDIWGAAAAKVISYAVMALLLFFVSQKFYPVQYEFRRMLHFLIIVCVLFLISTIDFVDASLLIKSLLLVIYPLILVITGFFSVDELNKARRILSI